MKPRYFQKNYSHFNNSFPCEFGYSYEQGVQFYFLVLMDFTVLIFCKSVFKLQFIYYFFFSSGRNVGACYHFHITESPLISLVLWYLFSAILAYKQLMIKAVWWKLFHWHPFCCLCDVLSGTQKLKASTLFCCGILWEVVSSQWTETDVRLCPLIWYLHTQASPS